MAGFELVADFKPMGDQPQAIAELVEGVNKGLRHQTLLGATGTGKTFTIATLSAGAETHAGHGAQQDAGRPALRGVQGVLPAQRGGVLCQLLRLLPAGSLHPSDTILYRERSHINEEIDRLRSRPRRR